MDATINHKLAWTVVGAASPAWAKQVFPELDEKAATERLWKKIFDTARVTEDPVKEWERHAEKLHEKAAWLNEEQFMELHYTSPVTDLTIGLPKNHYWAGGSKENSLGIKFMANMPTEEVFTAPDNRRINGYVTATKPLSYAGNILEGMRFSFKDGKVVEATAEKGQDVLDELLKNAGADSLGEVSLVPDESPISIRFMMKTQAITLRLGQPIRSTFKAEEKCRMKNCWNTASTSARRTLISWSDLPK